MQLRVVPIIAGKGPLDLAVRAATTRNPGRQVRTVGQPTMSAKSTRNRIRIPAQTRKTMRKKNRNTRGLQTWTQERQLTFVDLRGALDIPNFQPSYQNMTIFCVTETKLDQTDVISVPGYTFFSQQAEIYQKVGWYWSFLQTEFDM